MKNISTGFGLCAIAAAVALYPVLDRFAPIGKEAHAGVPASAITSAALAQIAPTIVWYGTAASWYRDNTGTGFIVNQVTRAWSDGRLEARFMRKATETYPANDVFCNSGVNCNNTWVTINDPNQGYSAASDANFDAQVDGADLALLLGNWGDAPRHDIPPSDCPLNLINP